MADFEHKDGCSQKGFCDCEDIAYVKKHGSLRIPDNCAVDTWLKKQKEIADIEWETEHLEATRYFWILIVLTALLFVGGVVMAVVTLH